MTSWRQSTMTAGSTTLRSSPRLADRRPLERKLLTKHLRNDINDDSPAEAAAEKQIDERILGCRYQNRHLGNRFHFQCSWIHFFVNASPRGVTTSFQELQTAYQEKRFSN